MMTVITSIASIVGVSAIIFFLAIMIALAIIRIKY